MRNNDKVHLQLVIDVHYDLDRTYDKSIVVNELKELLTDSAQHLASNGLLSGHTDSEVDTWNCSVVEVNDSTNGFLGWLRIASIVTFIVSWVFLLLTLFGFIRI